MNRLSSLLIALSNVRGPVARRVFPALAVLLALWVLAWFLLPGPRDPLAQALLLTAVGAGFATALGQFADVLSLHRKVPLVATAAGAICLLTSGWCLAREPSWGALARLGLPVLLVGGVWFYDFWFSVFRGSERVSRLRPGDRFPDFRLPNADGEPVTRESLLARGPAVMLFYKGDW